MISAVTYQATGSVVLAVTACLLSGGLIGLINGILVGFGGISPFMATLATMTFARGAALAMSDAQSIPIINCSLKEVRWIGGAGRAYRGSPEIVGI